MKPVGKYSDKVVCDLDARRNLKRTLEASVDHEEQKKSMAERAALIKDMQIKQGRDQIASGIRILQIIDSPDAAIKHLRNTLAAIDPTFEPREF